MSKPHANPCWLILCWLVAVPAVLAEEPRMPQAARAFVKSHCLDCHQGESAEAGLDLAQLPDDLEHDPTTRRWVRVFDRVASGEMPPEDASGVESEERKQFLSATGDWIRAAQRRAAQQLGRVRGRRLTNLQLERSLHDVLGVDLPLASRMPEEPRAERFTTVADGQSMSHFQLEQHLAIVDLALDEAFRRAIEGDDLKKEHLDAVAISRRNPKRRTREPEIIDGFAVTWSSGLTFYGRLPATTARHDGWYRFTVRAKALKPPAGRGVWCTVRTGRCVSSAPLYSWVGAFEATPEVQQWTFETWLPRGDMLEIRPGDDTLKRGRFAGGQVGTGEGGPQNVPGVAIESIVMEQIHRGRDDSSIRQLLFGQLEVKSKRDWRAAELVTKNPQHDLTSRLREFAGRAFRRPVEQADIAPYIELAMDLLERGEPPMDALRAGYRALLCSPRFLYFYEQPGQLDDYAIASRLSYMLCGAPPDAPLLELAAAGKLRQPEVIRQQVDRLLASPRGANFIPDLAAEWLELSEINFTTPDRRLYPGFDIVVQQSMVVETQTFLQAMLDENQSVTRLIDSEDGYLNERLARYYGVDGVQGDAMQRVTFRPEDRRGGLLTQGAILKITANGTNTSPVVRGVWVSERLLGETIPPPPAGIPAIEPDIRGAETIRQMLAKHKSDVSCAACHRAIDPPGFALENFDPSGRWRDRYTALDGRRRVKGAKIDPSHRFSDGQAFQSLAEFQKLLTAQPERLARNVAGQLITYGTGGPVQFADRGAVDKIVEQAAAKGYGFRSLLKAVVTSPVFLSK